RIGDEYIAQILRLHVAVWIEDVEQDGFGALITNRGQVRTDRIADTFQLMASGALLFENQLTAGCVSIELERLLIGGADILTASQLGGGEELAGPLANLGIGGGLKHVNPRGVHVAATYFALLHSVQEHGDPGRP